MKPVESAQTSVTRLADGRMRFGIVHDVIRDVTPEMIVWWFKNMDGDVTIAGRSIPRYRAWHPIDHVALEYLRPAHDGSNMGPGSSMRIHEFFQAKPEYEVRIVERVIRLDPGGFVHVHERAGIEVARMEYTFTRVDAGTLYENCLIVGMRAPILRVPFNALVRPRVLSDAMGRAWIRHNIEEVGNWEFFLPGLYDDCRRKG
jgi:hypothetical protein